MNTINQILYRIVISNMSYALTKLFAESEGEKFYILANATILYEICKTSMALKNPGIK